MEEIKIALRRYARNIEVRLTIQQGPLLRRKGVTCGDVSRLKSCLEPTRPLLGTPVSEGIWIHPSRRHSLKAIVSHG
jgi:hypothetical protein